MAHFVRQFGFHNPIILDSFKFSLPLVSLLVDDVYLVEVLMDLGLLSVQHWERALQLVLVPGPEWNISLLFQLLDLVGHLEPGSLAFLTELTVASTLTVRGQERS